MGNARKYFFKFFLSFCPTHIFKNNYKKYTHYIIIILYTNIGRAALEQAYIRNLCNLGSKYIYIHLCTKSISIKV